MALFRGIQEYIALDANNITLVFDSGNIVNISGNIFLYPPQGHPILYNYSVHATLLTRVLVTVADPGYLERGAIIDETTYHRQIFTQHMIMMNIWNT